MLDKINGISDINASFPLHFDSYNNIHSPGLNADVSGKGGGDSSPNGRLEEIMPILVKLTEQLMEMLQSDSAEDSASGEGEEGDGVVSALDKSGSAGHSSSDEEEKNKSDSMPMEGAMASEAVSAESGEAPTAMEGELGEIMQLLTQLVKQLMKMLQGDSSTKDSPSDQGAESGDAAASDNNSGAAHLQKVG